MPALGDAALRDPPLNQASFGDSARRPPAGRAGWVRGLALAVLLLAIAVPYTVTLVALWTRTGTDLDSAQRERDGVTMLRPLVKLLAASADLQSTAVAGRAVDATQTRAAIQAVDAADTQVGGRLEVSNRWADVRSRLNELLTTTPSGPSGYSTFTELTDLELALITAVGDSSRLVGDPSTDSYYLMDAASVRVPQLVVDAGRTADIALLTEQHRTVGRNDALVRAVAESDVQGEVTAIDDGLRKSFAATSSHTLGPGLLSQLDRLRDTAAILAPPAAAVGATPVARSAADVATARARLRDASLAVEQAGLDQLDLLLTARTDDLSGTLRLVGATTVAGLLLVAAMVWVRATRRRAGPAGGRSARIGLTTTRVGHR